MSFWEAYLTAQWVGVILGIGCVIWELPDARADVRPEFVIRDDTIEVIELNHYGSRFGCAALLFWDVNYEVCDWISYDGHEPTWDGQRWLLMFKRGGKTYLVRSREWCETRTEYNREVMERQRVPENKRRRLGEYRAMNPFMRVGE